MSSSATIELDGEYRLLREEAGAAERAERAVVAVSGPDAAEYLHSQLTQDIEALGTGDGAYAALLDRKGHMRSDMRVLRTAEDELVMDLERAGLDAVLSHLTMYSIGREVAVTDRSNELAVVSVAGPGAFELAGLPPIEPEYANAQTKIGDVEARAIRTDLGFDLIAARGDVAALLAALRDTGIETVSEDAFEILRVESGRPRFAREMTTKTIPQEAGLNERAVSFTKGCYIGQETVARLHYKGKPNRHLRGLRPASPVKAGDPVRLGERELGEVGTAVISPALGPLALAILRREAEPGAEVTVGEGIAAEVVELPFRDLGSA